jgi:predicted 2-oxoglutarate/Fe(II)-dependent dioxygenase YbiX
MYLPKDIEIEPTNVFAGCILVYENFWENPNDTIDEIESALNNENGFFQWNRAKDFYQKSNSSRTNSDFDIFSASRFNETLREINNRLFTKTFAAVMTYTRKMGIREPIFFDETFNILKYQTGQEYKAHYDGGTATKRAVSLILYLNDNYEGGHLEFVHQNVTIKPKPGMLVVFPSNYPYAHIAHPVTDGTKYAVVTWLHDQP